MEKKSNKNLMHVVRIGAGFALGAIITIIIWLTGVK